MKNKSASVIIGILLVIIGIGYIGNVFEVWNFKLFFPGWWTLFIIIPAAVNIIRNGFKPIYAIWLGAGVMLLVSKSGFFPAKLAELIFPLLLLCAGLTVVFRGRLSGGTSSGDSYIAIFSGRSPNYNGKNFNGAFATALFGGVDFKLAQAQITDGAVIDALAMFGGIDVILPKEANVEISCVPLFGGISEPKNRVHDDSYPTVHINAICLFGGIDVK